MKQLYIGELFKRADEFDLIHLQTEPVYLAMPYVSLIKTPVLFTSHNAYHSFEKKIFSFYDRKIHLSALSKHQASALPLTQDIPVIYNGIEINKYPFQDKSQDYFLFLGRLHKDKGIDVFLELAENLSQYSFYIAGKGQQLYEERIRNLTDRHKNIHYFGMIPHESPEWFNIISKAKALLMPITYDDPCPLVPLEAMASGTPVIAYSLGALPEQVIDGKTGFLINRSQNDIRGGWIVKKTGVKGLCKAVERIYAMPVDQYRQMRRNCRKHVEKKFTVERMVDEYEQVYYKVLEKAKK
jgi:glycosyltransferase involved in cell wall biosynthesis